MPTVRAALERLEASLFVDRQVESDEFSRWLTADSPRPEILQVIGHAGVGKSALLRAFARAAAGMGRDPVVTVDGEAISPTARDFARSVTGDPRGDIAAFLGDRAGLLVIDAVDELAPLTRWLTTSLIPSLSHQVRVVLAGRQPVGPMWKASLNVMRTLRLESLPSDAAAEYLERRGVRPEVASQVLDAAGGYPLALTLAADLAVQRGVTRFERAPEWHATLRGLVNELMKDAPTLGSLLEAAAVVRQFDEPTLAAVAGLEGNSQAFAELCAVSIVRPAQHGLTLHQDVRRLVIEELQWRNPQRLADLRRQARTYYRDRIRDRRQGEGWLVADRVYLWDHVVHATYFPTGETSNMWVEAGGPGDLDELLAIQGEFVGMLDAGLPLPSLPPPEECTPDFLRAIVALPGTEVSIARTPDGYAHGYGFSLRVSPALLAVLPPGGAVKSVIDRGLTPDARSRLGNDPDDPRVTYMSAVAVRGERVPEALGALAADFFRLALRGGIFLSCTGDESAAQVAAAIGMRRIPEVGTSQFRGGRSLDGWVVDIGSIGPDAWLEAITSGRRPQPALAYEQLEKELHQVFVRWADDARLAESPLAQVAPVDGAASPAEAVRAMVSSALERARARGTDENELAFRALELAYIEHKMAHEAIAERLNVSRSSFYRLLHRAEREVATLLAADRRS